MIKPSFIFISAVFLGSLLSPVFGQVPPDIERWSGSTALTQGQGFNMGDPLKLTWGFAMEGMTVPRDRTWTSADNDVRAFFDDIYGSQATWQPLFVSVFDRWSSISGLEYTYESNDDGAELTRWQVNGQFYVPGATGVAGTRADVRIASKPLDGNGGVLAFNFFPEVGDMVIDSSDNFYNNTNDNSRRLRNVLAHEHGHGLGMRHVDPVTGTILMEPFFSASYDGPQFHDILMAQRGYGDALERSNSHLGNDSLDLATSLGTIGDGSLISIGDDARELLVSLEDEDFISIDDESDTDFFSFTVDQAAAADITLEALGHIYEIGLDGGSTGDFDTQIRSDLALALYDTDGTTVLASSDLLSFGGSESLLNVALQSAGTYFIEITGQNNTDLVEVDTQFYGLEVGISFSSVPEPNSVALLCFVFGWGATRRRRATTLR